MTKRSKRFAPHYLAIILSFLLVVISPAILGNKKDSILSIIPRPMRIITTGNTQELPKDIVIYISSDSKSMRLVANYLQNRLVASVLDCHIRVDTKAILPSNIQLILRPSYDKNIGEEGYRISTVEGIEISGNTPNGIFNGIQTFFQLLPPQIYSNRPQKFDLTTPEVTIIDKPRFSYRGMHLDPCRHFFSVEFTKKYLDYMAYHKLNKFHWHLTEDQGWRIEIKKYPKLVEIGSKRSGTKILNHDVHWKDEKYDAIPVEGYYTQEQIREVVRYAQERFIEVIPEIEMPGHATAALAAYPQMSCTGGPFEVLRRPGIIEDVYCAGNDSVFVFLQDIIDEVVTLFPSKYIHIGGDECPKTRWEECEKCQHVLKENGLKDEKELQSWFIKRMEKYINSKGKTIIGWSEILEGGIAPNAVLESWIGTKAGIEAAQQDHQVIMSPYQYLYFDGIYVDKKHSRMEPFGQKYCWTNTEKAYSFEIIPDSIPMDFHPFFIGAEGTMWTEFIKTEDHLEYMLMPRISALSEICWSPKENKDYANFSYRMNQQYLRYDQLEAQYRLPTPIISDTITVSPNAEITIENPTLVTKILYTVDGSEPNPNSQVYNQPISILQNSILKARCLNKTGRLSSTTTTYIFIKEED